MRNNIRIIAISADIDSFKNERILDEAWSAKFPWASWISLLTKRLREKNFQVTTADVALSHVKEGYWNVQDIGVVQHLDNLETEQLIALGARPLLLTAFESPLYVPAFYNVVNLIAPKFPHRVMFSGLFDLFNGKHGVNYQIRFPSFNQSDLQEVVPWEKREFVSMFVGNKYGAHFSALYFRHPLDILKWLKRCLWSIKSLDSIKTLFVSRKFKKKQLHDKRLSAIIFFGQRNSLKLHGKGWDNIKILPRHYRKHLNPLLKRMKPLYTENKKEAMKKFKFVLCFENYSFPGYVTEKIIDCFVAGVIPVYLGAPDIEKFVPPNSFIDLRKYQSWDSLFDKLTNFTEQEAKRMIDSGRDFLTTSEGKLHTFEGFVSFLEGLILDECNGVVSVARRQ